MAEPKIAVPEIKDGPIQEMMDLGASLAKRQQTGTPRFQNISTNRGGARDILLNTLLGASAGGNNAAKFNQLGDPFVSALAGITGAAGAPTIEDIDNARAKAQAEAIAAQLEATPIEEISSDLVTKLKDKHGVDISGLTVGAVNKISPLIIGLEKAEKKDNVLERDIIDEGAALRFAQSEGIPPEYFLGQRRKDVTQQLISFRPAKKMAEAFVQTQQQLAILKQRWDEIKGDVGVLEGNARKFGAAVSGGQFNSKLAAYENARTAAITTVRSLFKDSGAPSNFDVERLLGVIPGVGTSAKKGEENWDIVQQLQSSGRNSLVQTYPLSQFILSKGAMATQQSQSASVAPQYKKYATNPKTGEKIGLNAATGQWEPVK